MAFQPFGPRFEIHSPWPPDRVKAAIRKRKKRWHDRKYGARGWILGRFICLWWNPCNRQGPMVLGRIIADGPGSRISGRAGSDLNGAVVVLLVSIAEIPITWAMVSSGQASLKGALIFAGLIAALVGLGFWIRGLFHQEAEPLVRFLRKTVAPKD